MYAKDQIVYKPLKWQVLIYVIFFFFLVGVECMSVSVCLKINHLRITDCVYSLFRCGREAPLYGCIPIQQSSSLSLPHSFFILFSLFTPSSFFFLTCFSFIYLTLFFLYSFFIFYSVFATFFSLKLLFLCLF